MRYCICTKDGYLSSIFRDSDGVTAQFSDTLNCCDFDNLAFAMIMAIKYSIMLNRYDFFIKDSYNVIYNVISNIDSIMLKCCKEVTKKFNISDDYLRMVNFIRHMFINQHNCGNVYVLVDTKTSDQKFVDFIKYFEIYDHSHASKVYLSPKHSLLITTITNDNLLINYKLLGNYDDIVYLNCDEEPKTF